ncbi:MAG: hypothetical protein ACREVY_06115 [Gammaproteobacteria bacterium]
MSKTSKITLSGAQRLQELGFDPLEALIKPEMTPVLRRVAAKRLYRYWDTRPGLLAKARKATGEKRDG